METKTSAVSEEVAVKELVDFYNHFSLEPLTEDEVLDDLNIAKLAVMEGLLSFDKETKVPTYKLRNAILNDKKEPTLEEVTFKTRIFPNDHVRLSKGINIQKETMAYAMRCTAHLASLPSPAYLNKFSRFDYTVIQQIGTVFA